MDLEPTIPTLFGMPRALIGMLHLGPLPGSPGHRRGEPSIDLHIERAVTEAETYRAAEVAAPVLAAIASRRPAAAAVAVEVPLPTEVPGELREVLHGLSQVMADDGRSARIKPLPVPAKPKERTTQPPPGTPLEVVVSRREPTLVGDGDVDLGPVFSIDDDLHEDERPVRARRS